MSTSIADTCARIAAELNPPGQPFTYRCEGEENVPATGPALVVANHPTYLDPVLLSLEVKRPILFMAWDAVFRVPLLGAFLRAMGAFPVDVRRGQGRKAYEKARALLQAGHLVGLFPEGTRQSGSQPVGELKPGFLSILRRTNVPVIPVGIAGASAVMPRGAVVPRLRPVRVVFGKPIPKAALTAHTGRGHEQDLLALVAFHMAASVTAAEAWLAYSDSTPHNF